MKIKKENAVAIFLALGITTAPKWNNTRLTAKLNKLPEMVDADSDLGDTEADANKVLAALENGAKVELDLDGDAPATKGGKAKKPAAKAKTPAKGGKAKKPATAKKAAKKAPAEKSGPVGVREMPTRAYFAGQVVAERGIAAGITPDMVEEVDERYGKENPVETLYRLRDAWHAIRAAEDVAKTKRKAAAAKKK